jgi:hypothetical protein
MLARGARLTKERELCCGLFLRNFLRFMFYGRMDSGRISRLWNSLVYTQNADVKIVSGCSKSSPGKAAGESKPEAYPQGYVEDFDELRTKLADFFSSLLVRSCWGRLRPC